ncbi:MAG: lamin tail domain-containing protein [Candidatus Campbellbacteria bacterium]|nr:lamin tail domain-containing protein [Candidatus Campbellbacteria bacterium]
MIKNTLLFLCALAMLPMVTNAQIIINEIAWMGTTVSANDEWIELYNTGAESVSLSGWKLWAQDEDPKITLSGEIPTGGYFLLERTDDESVLGVSAGVIYTGGLGNTGETLELFDASGAVVDSAIGATNWSLGGDNTAKNTPQRQADNLWITGVPTPGVQNSTEHIAPSTGEVKGASTSTTSTTTKKTSVGYTQNLFVYAGEDMQAIAGAYAFFEGYGVDRFGEHTGVSKYRWSFGDGDDGEGKSTSHIYRFPGTYTAVTSISAQYQHAHDGVSVHVISADVSLSSVLYGEDGYVEISNNSDVALDLSLWKLQAEYAEGKKRGHVFTIPMTTTIAPHTKVPFPATITKVQLKETDRVALIYPNGKEAAAFEGVLYNIEDMKARISKKK